MENFAALRAAVFPLLMKNLKGGYTPAPRSVHVLTRSVHRMAKSDCACAASDAVVGITEVRQHRARLELGWVTAWKRRGCGWRDSNRRFGSRLLKLNNYIFKLHLHTEFS